MIEIIDLHKRYRTDHGLGRWVLTGINLTIPANRSVGLIGRNGAGKSTLLRLIGGIDSPDHGRVIRHCRTSWPLGLAGGLQGSLTGRQNARFVCRLHGLDARMHETLEFINDFAELGEAFDEPIKTYSSGMQARLKFAMSLAFDFDIYLVDELTSVGDAAFRRKANQAFKQLAGRSSLIMVAHSESTLRQFCESGIWLDQGKAYWFDDINDALAQYNHSLSL
ncbi:sugar ABC transporter ATPase [Lampropedia cohaerens]|uniref:Sugar ABC transporter ATPase n=1 Tax=Lampropedia cohaerens TaxID=1610491 RepID=A0A0U1PZF4_9BURK|nr:ABC transporter ATP-binding protein [Lampropedia cohaerens]KKW67735.1 sugar ABC transporter ATPase [Lampropedia cohaerens]